jgi:hypothetical protein
MGGADVEERHCLELQGADAYRFTVENVIDGEWRVTSVQWYRRA